MLSYLKARASELSSILSASGAAGVMSAWLLGKADGKTTLVGLAVCAVGYLMPQDKPVAQLVGQAVLDATKKAGVFLLAAVMAGALSLAGCGSASQVASELQTALASPAGQSLLTMVESFSPGVAGVVTKINNGLATSQADLQMACGAASEANGLFQLAAPFFGASQADMQAEAATMAAVNTACSGSTTNLTAAIQTALAAYQSFMAQLQGAGVPVTVPAAAPAPASPAATAPATSS